MSLSRASKPNSLGLTLDTVALGRPLEVHLVLKDSRNFLSGLTDVSLNEQWTHTFRGY